MAITKSDCRPLVLLTGPHPIPQVASADQSAAGAHMRWFGEPAADGCFGLRADRPPGDHIAAAELSTRVMALVSGCLLYTSPSPRD